MKYIHIKNIEKYHPNYKDRKLIWAKIYFNMVQGDPDCEMITDEIDWARFIKLIILELQAQKPIPLDYDYLSKKGFNLKKRKIELTFQSLQTFIEIRNETVTEPLQSCDAYYIREEEEKNREDKNNVDFDFESIWKEYPVREGRKDAERHFLASVKTERDFEDIKKALKNYKSKIERDKTQRQYIKHGSTWFNNWRDYVDLYIPKTQSESIENMKKNLHKQGYCSCGGKIEKAVDDKQRCSRCNVEYSDMPNMSFKKIEQGKVNLS